jgi:hypothetical protein
LAQNAAIGGENNKVEPCFYYADYQVYSQVNISWSETTTPKQDFSMIAFTTTMSTNHGYCSLFVVAVIFSIPQSTSVGAGASIGFITATY